MPKITKLCLHLLSYAEKSLASFFPDTVYMAHCAVVFAIAQLSCINVPILLNIT